jgi:uncharacterized protein (DUF697 family)
MNNEQRQARALEIIKNHVGFSLGAALIPFPGADLLAVSGVQLNMLRQLAGVYQVGFFDALGRNIISAVAGGSVARLGASLIKILPGIGTIIGELSMPALSGASTYALGRVVANHFQQGGTLEDLNLSQARRRYATEMREAKTVATEMARNQPPREPIASDPLDKLKRVSELHQAGVLTDQEFQELKTRLLQEV